MRKQAWHRQLTVEEDPVDTISQLMAMMIFILVSWVTTNHMVRHTWGYRTDRLTIPLRVSHMV